MPIRPKKQRITPFQVTVIISSVLMVLFALTTLYRLLITPSSHIESPVAIAGWGDDQFGQVGDGHILAGAAVTKPKHYTLNNVTAVDAGLHHSLALTRDGMVMSWGDNQYGQLGAHKTGGVRPTPKQIDGLNGIMQVAAGQDHSLALDKTGRVWAWGLNMSGQLGDGTNDNNPDPRIVPGLSDVHQVAAGYRSSLVVKNDGTVWAWGGFCNLKSRTKNLQDYIANLSIGGYGHGDGGTIDDVTPEEDCLYEDYLGVKSYHPVQITGLPPIEHVDIGWGHVLAITKKGELWSWGCNMYGQLGLSKGPSTPAIHTPAKVKDIGTVREVSAGYRHSLAITTDGKVWAWGHNYFGETAGASDNVIVAAPREVVLSRKIQHVYGGHDYSLFLTDKGELWGLGQTSAGQLAVQGDLQRVPLRVSSEYFSSVAAGGAHGLGLVK